MAIKIISKEPDKSVVKRCVCKNCGATLEYTPNDVGAEACFLPVYEKAITLMRWIRRSNENGTLLKISE